MKYKVLLLDIDGTVLPIKEKSKPSQRVIEAINLASKYIHVGLMTSRAYPDFRPLLDYFTLTAPCALNSGAEVIDPVTRAVLWQKALSRDELRLAYRIISSFNVKMHVQEDDHAKRYAPGRKYYQPLSFYTPAIPQKKALEISQSLSRHKVFSTHRVTAWEKHTEHIYISHREASKKQALFDISEHLHIPLSDIMGVGDGPNDMGFLEQCGFSIAMGNAPQEVKSIVDYVAPSVDEDGVAEIIEKFILERNSK